MTNDDLQVMFDATAESIQVPGPPPGLAQFHRAARVRRLRRVGFAAASIALVGTGTALVANMDPSVDESAPVAGQPGPPAKLSCPSGRRAVFLSEPTFRSKTFPTVELLAAASVDITVGESWVISQPSGFESGVLLLGRDGLPFKELLLEYVAPGNRLNLPAGWVAASYATCEGLPQ